MEYVFGERTIACTHVERVVFPADGITKGEVLAYYRDVADLVVPELARRPLTVVRYPRGLEHGGFYQKHYQRHYPAWLDRIATGGKTRVEYPIVDDPAGLVYLVNQGAIELHVGTSRAGALDRPDTLVIDLDPPDGRFELARRAAPAVREVFDQLGLPAFLKLTGKKGLHVVAPLDGAASFAEVGGLATRIGAVLCRRHPDLLTMAFYKAERGGRLFLDVLRNAPGATVVAPYSLRGQPGAPVAAPIAWAELDDPALGADQLRLRDLRARLDRTGDPWRDLRARPGAAAAAAAALATLDA